MDVCIHLYTEHFVADRNAAVCAGVAAYGMFWEQTLAEGAGVAGTRIRTGPDEGRGASVWPR